MRSDPTTEAATPRLGQTGPPSDEQLMRKKAFRMPSGPGTWMLGLLGAIICLALVKDAVEAGGPVFSPQGLVGVAVIATICVGVLLGFLSIDRMGLRVDHRGIDLSSPEYLRRRRISWLDIERFSVRETAMWNLCVSAILRDGSEVECRALHANNVGLRRNGPETVRLLARQLNRRLVLERRRLSV